MSTLANAPEITQTPETDDMGMDMATQNYLNQPMDRLDRQMTTSRLQNDPDAMDIDVAPSNEVKLPDSQNLPWADYIERRFGEQQDGAFQLWSPSWDNISPWLNETLHSDQNNTNTSMNNRRTICGACMETINPETVITIGCGCHYCRSCFNGYFETGLVNRGSFPPRCCGQEIILHSVRQYLESRVVERYEDVQEEFSSRNPTYCADCGAFLPGAAIFADFKACRKCFQQTCIRCKNPRPLHQGPDKLSRPNLAATDRERDRHCPGVTVPPEIMALIKKEEWSRCPSCQHVVEKTDGCNFMECICGAEFCYGCGMEYGTNEYCECPDNLADEEDGLDTEEEVDGDEGEEWPRFFAAVNARGRIRCMHELTTLLNDGGDGEDSSGRCHGCLREMPEIRSCETCQLELCSECLH